MLLDRVQGGIDDQAAVEGAERQRRSERLDQESHAEGGRLLVIVKPMPPAEAPRPRPSRPRSGVLSGVTRVPSTSETTRADAGHGGS